MKDIMDLESSRVIDLMDPQSDAWRDRRLVSELYPHVDDARLTRALTDSWGEVRAVRALAAWPDSRTVRALAAAGWDDARISRVCGEVGWSGDRIDLAMESLV